ncbi:DUF2520 domain-containing protein [Ornithobacterium rhinotracheale]|uniref:Rossmann-like and DUF2520 domain-containing protein n=1 Tax=Ornithobacterium rhinotracheale TaxID=28251 RepID=UPI00129CE1C1|nr:Rossmann-like and DUF2520 domain-containing protein [Ornithobacterium rhinotracheale]MRI62638.1 DUF2520 domain-containing protein [Ornithobacterium rhinotracheale]MRJ07726.1 DUF2520 domain-containing protein [Ornithobacterium rhinotracheale]UOH78321.1 DUF2520 domain-containing protein [Ornithobacterium rhinotracheale]
MKSVTIIGAGNVAFHLTRAFVSNTVQVNQIYNRTLSKAQAIGEANNIRYTDKISELKRSDLFIIASSDVAIEELSMHIPFNDVMVVHTSGAMPMSTLKGNYRKGVLYPMQTFSRNRKLDYSEIPFFVEAENPEDEKALLALAERVSNRAKILNSEQRAQMHLSAVWACNFVNHMYFIAQKTAEEVGLGFEYLRPLIEETALKIEDLTPFEAQTGPAKRNDQITIEKHLSLIKDSYLKDMYNDISNSINKTYHGEL